MILTSNAFTYHKPGSRHRAGKRVQAKKAKHALRQQEALELATRVTDDAFPALPGSPREPHDEDEVVMAIIRAVEYMVEEVGGDIIWPGDY